MNKNSIDAGANGVDDKIDSLRDTMKGIVDNGSQKVDALKTKVVEVKDQALTRGSDLLSSVSGLIKEHPLKAIGIAFGAGYIGMRLLRR